MLYDNEEKLESVIAEEVGWDVHIIADRLFRSKGDFCRDYIETRHHGYPPLSFVIRKSMPLHT